MGAVFSHTVMQNQRAAIWKNNGTVSFVDGPARVSRFGNELQLLQRVVATPNEFIVIKFTSGDCTVIQGPASIWNDPVEHQSVTVGAAFTVPSGRFASVQSPNGQLVVVEGPASLPKHDNQLTLLSFYTADEYEYLCVHFVDGHCENFPGPCSMSCSPLCHVSISVKKALIVNAGEVLVVYQQEPKKLEQEVPLVRRRLVYGPLAHIPRPDEWIHEFSWHGRDPNREPGYKKPCSLRFTKLRVVPDQLYYNVRDVRTSDDTLLTLQLMIFFELKDVTQMLEGTLDPIGDFINAVCADVISFAVKLSYEKFCESVNSLNELVTYERLLERAKRIGYQINKIVYRGYCASSELQAMHDAAIQARTKLHLDEETEEKRHKLDDLRLHKEGERQKKKQLIEQQEEDHKLAIQRKINDESLRKVRASNEEEFRHLQELKHVGVDLTKFLVASKQEGSKVINICSSDDCNSSSTQQQHPSSSVHVHVEN